MSATTADPATAIADAAEGPNRFFMVVCTDEPNSPANPTDTPYTWILTGLRDAARDEWLFTEGDARRLADAITAEVPGVSAVAAEWYLSATDLADGERNPVDDVARRLFGVSR